MCPENKHVAISDVWWKLNIDKNHSMKSERKSRKKEQTEQINAAWHSLTFANVDARKHNTYRQ